MAKKYHPDNQTTGDTVKFNILTTAYKTQAHSEKRAAYDATFESSKNQQWQSIANTLVSEGYETDHHVRRMILSILYTKKRGNPSDAGVGVVQLENIMQWPAETLDFHIWYLKEKKLIQRTESRRIWHHRRRRRQDRNRWPAFQKRSIVDRAKGLV